MPEFAGGARGLLAATALFAVYGVGQVWLVQLSSYRLWSFVGRAEFDAYHRAWWRSIWGPVLAPAALVFAGAAAMLWVPPPGVPAWVVSAGFALEALLAAGTALWWGPLMARVGDPRTGLIPSRYRQLMRTHWIRVALVTGYGALASWMLLRALALPGSAR